MRAEVGKITRMPDGQLVSGKNFISIDADTGKQIPFCIMSDDETGEYLAYATKDDRRYMATDDLGRVLTGANRQVAKIAGRKNIILKRIR